MGDFIKELLCGIATLILCALVVFVIICLFILFVASIVYSVILCFELLRGNPATWQMIVAPIIFCLFAGGFIMAEINDG